MEDYIFPFLLYTLYFYIKNKKELSRIKMNLKDLFRPLDYSNFNIYHARSLLITTLGMFTISYNTTFVAVALHSLSTQFHIQVGSLLFDLLGTASLWTAVAGALIFGITANFKGRRAVYGYESLLLAIGSLLGAFAPNVYWLILTQAIFGIGIGGDFVLSPIVLGEFSNAKDRGKLLAFAVGVTGPIGSIASALTFLGLDALGITGSLQWRLVLALGAIIPASVVYLRRKVPESPRYLLRIKGDVAQFSNVVKTVTGKLVDVKIDTKDNFPTLKYMRKYASAIFIAGLLWFLDHMVNPGGVFEVDLVGRALGFTNGAIFSLLITLVSSIPGGIVALLLIDRWGRKPLESIGFLGMSISLILFAYFFKIGHYPASILASLGLFLIIMYHFWHNVGPANVSAAGVFNVELLPTKIRGIGSAIVVAIDRSGALVNSAIFPFLFTNFGLGLAVGVGGMMGIIAVLVTLFFVKETKQKPLEESSQEEMFFGVENP